MEGSTSAADLSRLCQSCGLCCNGVLFDYVDIEEQERASLERLGFDLERVAEDRLRFVHPCHQFRDNCCSIYQERPSVCRTFQCELLKAAKSGEVPLNEALERVVEAKGMVSRSWPRLQDLAGGS